MTSWVLIIYIASDLWLPFLSFKTEDECYQYLERELKLEPGYRATCLPGVIEAEPKAKARRK